MRKILDIGPSEEPTSAVRWYLIMAALPLVALIVALLLIIF